ncbi:MAG: hypothetical protein RR635_10985, partial [Oscillospiraceae bacterium]
MIVAGGVLALAVLLTLYLNASKMGYTLLYTEMDATESAEVYAALQNLEVPVEARMNGNGEVEVPTKDKDKALIEMALQGIPR